MYRLSQTHHAIKRWWVLWLLVALVVAGALTCGGWLIAAGHRHVHVVTAPVKKAAAAPTEGVSTRLMFTGDVFWGRSVQTAAEKSGQGYSYITSKLSEADRSQYNAWIANFECPITSKDVLYQLQVNSLVFNCRPEYLQNLSKWFTAVTLANNHTDNNGGDWGLEQTRANLQAAGIQYFGDYDMNKTDNICEVVTVPATTTVTNKTVSLPVALCGYMYVTDDTPTDAQLAVMEQYAKVMPVIAMPHMGVEYRPTAEPAKVSAYERMIANGADMVVGSHPHVIQNTESYGGKLIVYSEGNFLFDQQSLGRAETLGLAVGVKLTVQASYAKDVAAYEQVAPSCKIYKDDCLAQLQAKIKKRREITVSYTMTCYDEASGLPELGSTAACDQAGQMATVSSLKDLSPDW